MKGQGDENKYEEDGEQKIVTEQSEHKKKTKNEVQQNGESAAEEGSERTLNTE